MKKLLTKPILDKSSKSEAKLGEMEANLQAESKYEQEKRKRVKDLIYVEYKLYIGKAFRKLIFVLTILVSLISVIRTVNVWAAFVLVATTVASFKKFNFKNLKWLCLFLSIIFFLKYMSALANLSSTNSPSVFPTPFNDRGLKRPLRVPIYREFGSPITKVVTSGPEQGENRPTEWAFFLGFMISAGRIFYMWMDFAVLLLINYYVMYFYSVSYELNVNLNTEEAVIKNLAEIEQEAEESVKEEMKDSFDGSLKDSFRDSIVKDNPYEDPGMKLEHRPLSLSRSTAKMYNDAREYIEKIKKSMYLVKLYNGVSTAICATSTIITLVCLLMISFQVEGIINFIYICFCLYFIAKAINFVYQKRWTFPWYMKNVLKVIVITEIFLQFMFQTPWSPLHNNEDKSTSWQRIIGFYRVWQLGEDNLPMSMNASNILLKCVMFANILLQQCIFASKEYNTFKVSTLVGIRSLSERKAEAMAYLYNNFKIKTTIQNAYEKDTMIKKLVKVNKQLKKWNSTVFSKSKGEKESEQFKRMKERFKKESEEEKKITEVDHRLEDDAKKMTTKEIEKLPPTEKAIAQEKKLTDSEKKKHKADEKKRQETIDREKKYEDMAEADLMIALTEDKIGIIWKIWILGMRYLTNQILMIFTLSKLDSILEKVKDGETRIYTNVEKDMLADYKANKAIRDENEEYEILDDIPEEQRSDKFGKSTKSYKIVIAYFTLFIHMLLSNSVFVCYLFMIIAHIMDGSFVSLVYPFTIFIYALLEERRPSKNYWMFIIYYTSVVLMLKFLFQTYPLNDWLTQGGATDDPDSTEVPTWSVNDYLRAVRIGIEVIEEDQRKFINYFLFDAFILLAVTLHIFLQVFAGVWYKREIEQENIHQAAARIANVQKQRRLEKEGREVKQLSSGYSEDSDELELMKNLDNNICPPDYFRLKRRRIFSENDCTRLTEVAEQLEKEGRRDSMAGDSDVDEWPEIEQNFAYGGKKYNDHEDIDNIDYALKKMKKMTRSEFLSKKESIKRRMTNLFATQYKLKQSDQENNADCLKTSQRSLTEYQYKRPDDSELRDFLIENKVGPNFIKKWWLKIKITLTQSEYFESLFPSIKEQKPGFDLYAPMAGVQVLIIVFMIFFYTSMDPDYSNITQSDLTPQRFNSIMVIAVFIQIAIIVLDRYLYLSRDYIVIDEVNIEEEESEEEADVEHSDSLSQFDRTKTFDIRSSSGGKLLVKGLNLKKDYNLKNAAIEKKKFNDSDDDDQEDSVLLDEDNVQLSKTNFNKTILLKYYLQLTLLIFVHLMTFWYFPIKANVDVQGFPFCTYSGNLDIDDSAGTNNCNEVYQNWTLVVFYLLYCLYFAFSALQIRYGLPELRKGNFAMGNTTAINKGIFNAYLAAPFVLELKIVSDWTFTKTALDLFQWIKFESIYADLFIAK